MSSNENQSYLQRIAAGDPAAVAECIDQYGNLVWSLARRFTYEETEAEDAVQEIFIDLWTHAGRYDPDKSAESTFVAMIARRRLIDGYRRRQRRPGLDALDQQPEPIDPDAQRMIETGADATTAARAVETLRPEQRKVLRLSVYEGYSHGDIAARLDMPLGTVKTHLRRGLIAVREALAAGDGDGGRDR